MTTLNSEGTSPKWNLHIKIVVTVTALVILGLAFYLFRVVFVPLIIGILMAYIFSPVVHRIQRWTRLPRGLATGLLYLILLTLVVPIVWALMPVVINQLVYLQSQFVRFLNYLETLAPGTTVLLIGFEFDVQMLVDEITTSITGMITSVAPESITLVLGAARTSLLVVFTLVIGFYLTRDADRVIDWLSGLVPPTYDSDTFNLLKEIDRIWASFFRGQVTLSVTVTIILTVLSILLGLPRPFLLGVWGGLLEFLPSIGNVIWGATVVILALLQGSTYLPLPNGLFALIVFGVYVAFAQVDMNILIPYIIGNRVRLHPVVVILGVIIGATLGGVLGVALAAPTIACFRVIGRYVYAKMFDLDPFPMVGPPSAPIQEREAEAERIAAETPTPQPIQEVIAKRVKRRRKKSGAEAE